MQKLFGHRTANRVCLDHQTVEWQQILYYIAVDIYKKSHTHTSECLHNNSAGILFLNPARDTIAHSPTDCPSDYSVCVKRLAIVITLTMNWSKEYKMFNLIANVPLCSMLNAKWVPFSFFPLSLTRTAIIQMYRLINMWKLMSKRASLRPNFSGLHGFAFNKL